MSDDIGAFVPGPRIYIEGRSGGPLAGLTFAAIMLVVETTVLQPWELRTNAWRRHA